MVNSKIYALILLSLLNFTKAADDDTTTTVTTTPINEQTTTVGLQEDVYGTEYIFTDENGSLTTTTVIGATSTGPYTLSEEETSSPTSSTTAETVTDSASASEYASFRALSGSNSQITSTSTASTSTSTSTSDVDDDDDESTSSIATSQSNNPYFTEIKISVPSGVYSTSTSYSETVLSNGKTAVLELVVLHTAIC